MIDEEFLTEPPGGDVDTEEWTDHHRLFYRLVLGTTGARSDDLQLLYDAVAPLAFKGTTDTPHSSRRWRRKLLNDLADAEVISAHETPRGLVWVPADYDYNKGRWNTQTPGEDCKDGGEV